VLVLLMLVLLLLLLLRRLVVVRCLLMLLVVVVVVVVVLLLLLLLLLVVVLLLLLLVQLPWLKAVFAPALALALASHTSSPVYTFPSFAFATLFIGESFHGQFTALDRVPLVLPVCQYHLHRTSIGEAYKRVDMVLLATLDVTLGKPPILPEVAREILY
jgi:hypothetical protein